MEEHLTASEVSENQFWRVEFSETFDRHPNFSLNTVLKDIWQLNKVEEINFG